MTRLCSGEVVRPSNQESGSNSVRRPPGGISGTGGSSLRVAERGAVDADGVALVAESAEQRVDECLVAEKVVPLLVGQVGRDDRRVLAVALLHELEEDVGLLGAEVEVAHLVDAQDIDPGGAVEEFPGRAGGGRGG